MKTLLIFLLGVALIAGLYLSRPSQKSFGESLAAKSGEGDSNVVTQLVKKGAAELDAKTYDYKDHYLWCTEERNGKTVYVGVFSQWFKTGGEN